MIGGSALAAAVLRYGIQRRSIRVESWYGETLIDDDVPVHGGGLEVDRSWAVPERLRLDVPRVHRGTDYTPTDVASPLAANGQRLRVQVGVGLAGNAVEWLDLGEYVITGSEPQGDTVEVEAAGLLWLIQEARLTAPLQPTGTLQSVVRSLVEPALTVVFDSALVNRAIPSGINYDDDRLQALNLTLDAWPATSEVRDGYLYVLPVADPATSVLTLTDGVGGTVIRGGVRGNSTRDGAYNAVVFEGQTSDGQVVRGVAYDYSSPKRVGGPFNPLPVPLKADSPLITTATQAQAAANTRLATLLRTTSQSYEVEMVPHPALQAGDRVTLVADTYGTFDGIVEALRLPLLHDGGTEGLRVRRLT